MVQPGTRWNPALRKRGTSEIRGRPAPRGVVGITFDIFANVNTLSADLFLYHSHPPGHPPLAFFCIIHIPLLSCNPAWQPLWSHGPQGQTHTHTLSHKHTHAHTHTRTHRSTYAHTHTCTHTHTHVYTHMHTHTHAHIPRILFSKFPNFQISKFPNFSEALVTTMRTH